VSFDKKRIPAKEQLEALRIDLKNKLFLHHRLDYETSGVFLMSKSSQINKQLTEMFTHHDFTKTYHCLAYNNELKVGKKADVQIINDHQWIIKNYMAPAKGMVNHKKRMISVKSGGWPAETEFSILEKKKDFMYLQARPKTGRTHQIRQHLQESYRSILGDNIYGGKSDKVPRLMLHAYQLDFSHPHFKTPISVRAPLPQDFKTLLGIS
jgi:23S rRNA-/tRNA-specific pseudouridylate synthase